MKKEICTLSILVQNENILLGEKKKGFGRGKWNGFGGKVKKGEAIETAARREIKEECGLEASVEKAGILYFSLPERRPVKELEVHVFSISNFSGQIKESEEMRPRWFKISEIPYSEMWPDDRHWLPLFLKGKKFRGTFILGDKDVILNQNLQVVSEI